MDRVLQTVMYYVNIITKQIITLELKGLEAKGQFVPS